MANLRNIDFNTIFDPDQDPDEKRAVRQNYRSLTKKIEGMSYNVAILVIYTKEFRTSSKSQ